MPAEEKISDDLSPKSASHTSRRNLCTATWGTGLIMLALSGWIGCSDSSAPSDPADASSQLRKSRVIAQGQILPANGIAQLSGRPGDAVDELHVAVGDRVEAGELLVTLKSNAVQNLQLATLRKRRLEAQREQQNTLEQLEEQLAANRLQLEQAEAQGKTLESQAELLELAQEQVGASESILERMQRIASDATTSEFVSQLELERQQVAVREAQLDYEKRKLEHQQASDQQRGAVQVAQQKVASAERMLNSALDSAALDVLDLEIETLELEASASKITAPIAGKILQINARKGESSVGRPLIEMADDSNLVCELEVNEMDASLVAAGQPVRIHSRAFNEQLEGRVVQKHSLVGSPQLRTTDPLARSDYRQITVVVELNEASQELARDWLQLQVEAEINVKADN